MEPIIKAANGKKPNIHPSAFVAPTAVILGDVEIGPDASVWFHCLVDGREGKITIGARTNIQDGSRLRTVGGNIEIGEDVLVGHSVTLLAENRDCSLEDESFVGIKSAVNSAVVRSKSIVAACGVVAPGTEIVSGEMWGGAPAQKLRDLKAGEDLWAKGGAAHYVHEAEVHTNALKTMLGEGA